MASPFIVIRTFTIKEGKLEAFKRSLGEFFRIIEANEPRLLALNAYLNEDGTEVTFVHVHPDAASMETHEEGAHGHTEQVSKECLDATKRLEIYGTPSDIIRETLKQLVTTGIPVRVMPEGVGGFTRLTTVMR